MFNRAFSPFDDMLSLRDAVNQLLEGSVVRPGFALGSVASSTFPINVYATDDDLTVEALLPGISEEDMQVTIDQGVLTMTAKRHLPGAREGQQWYLREIVGGQFSRSLNLPFPVETDQVHANFANGVLTLTLPKAAAAKPKKIQIGTGQQQPQLAEQVRH